MRTASWGMVMLVFLVGCATGGRWNPSSAVADAERDIASSRLRFAYVGGFVPTAPGLPMTEATYNILNRYERLEVGPQGCIPDEHSDQCREYARRYNLRMWSYVADRLGKK